MADGVKVKVLNARRLQLKMLAMISEPMKAKIKKANQKSADEFMSMVRLAVPQDPHARPPHLVASLVQGDRGETGKFVAIGNADTPYPAHLEFGHRFPDGGRAEPKPFWFPAKRVLQKRSATRLKTAVRAAIKDIALSQTGGG